MTPEALLLFLLLAAMIYLFMSERLPIDLTAFLGLLILLLAGYVTAEQAFTGFGALAVLLLVPIAIQSAAELGVSPYPLSMGVALGASMVFLTPFSGKSSLLVMNAGGDRTMDFFKVGAPLTIPLILLVIYLIPLFFPF